jgi:hypothetical protein
MHRTLLRTGKTALRDGRFYRLLQDLTNYTQVAIDLLRHGGDLL